MHRECKARASATRWHTPSRLSSPATSAAIDATPPPTTAASSVHPVAAAIACPAVMVSHETRFSFPSRCSTTTRIVSAIKSALSSQLSSSQSQTMSGQPPSAAGRPQRMRPQLHYSTRNSFRSLSTSFFAISRRRPFNVLRLLRLLRHVQLLDLLQILADRRLHFRRAPPSAAACSSPA